MSELIFNSSVFVKIGLFLMAALIIGLAVALRKVYKLSREREAILELADAMRTELTERRERIEKLTAEVAELKMRKVMEEDPTDVLDETAADAEEAGEDGKLPKESSPVIGRQEVILIAEDNADLCEAAANMLREAGFLVETAENGTIAVEKYSSSEEGFFRLILMDLKMPEMNGIDAAAQIRASERKDAKSIPIIAMTANAFEGDIAEIESAGMNSYIRKPLEASALAAVVREYLEKDHVEEESKDEEHSSKIVSLRAI